jgi:hypothetical protein
MSSSSLGIFFNVQFSSYALIPKVYSSFTCNFISVISFFWFLIFPGPGLISLTKSSFKQFFLFSHQGRGK